MAAVKSTENAPAFQYHFTCGCLFPPPGQSVAEVTITNISTGIDSILNKHPSSGIVITGDFNKLNLEPLCRRFGLRKMVKSPTRGNAVLDQFLTNMSDILAPAQHLPPLGRSDHQCLLFKPKNRLKLLPVTRKVRKMTPRNIQSLTIAMNKENWETVINANNVDEKVFVFYTLIGNVLNTTMPERSTRTHPTDKPRITPCIKAHIKERQMAYTAGADCSKHD